ncbi:MAG TPA: CDP-alcohol phosphatidyltransferase family protein [Blastocatellia bacterium]|nr:CDP-alcohol phosphatidyltransferase family protein [Blastocatellia bacterium]
MSISSAIGNGCTLILDAIVRTIARSKIITPNILTMVGLLINIWCAYLYGRGHFFTGGLVLILANVFDMLDGRVARLQGRVTRFGAFFDSVIDRYSDLIVFVGIMVFYARDTAAHSTLYVALTGIVLIGSVMVSYSRARAEGLDITCKVGFLERPERVVLLIIGSLTQVSPGTYQAVANISHVAAELMFYKMRAVLWVMAVLSHWTVIHRVYHTRDELTLSDTTRQESSQRADVAGTPAGRESQHMLGASRLRPQ